MMRYTPGSGSGTDRARALRRLCLALLVVVLGLGGRATAQEAPPTIGGFPPILPQLPQTGPRPPSGPESVPAFVESLGASDAAFEVVVRQGRLLTLKEALVKPNQASPVVAVGDPNVLDFEVLSPQLIRVHGKKLGVTDLAITTGAGKTYSFVIQVVADLPVLRAQLKQMFPDASLRLSQIRDHVVVEGQARTEDQHALIIRTVKAYLRSVHQSQEGGQGDRQQSAGDARPEGTAPPAGAAPAPAPGATPPPGAAPAPPDAPAPGTPTAPGSARGALSPEADAPGDGQLSRVSMPPAPGAAAPVDARVKKAAMQAAPGAAAPGTPAPPPGAEVTTTTLPGGTAVTRYRVPSEEEAGPEVIDLIQVPAPPDPLQELQGRLKELFPDASLRLSKVGESLVVEGKARGDQIERIVQTIRAYLESARDRTGTGAPATPPDIVNLLEPLPPPATPPALQNLRDQLKEIFPDAGLRLTQIRDGVIVVEGQARDSAQVDQILTMINAFLERASVQENRQDSQQAARDAAASGGNATAPGGGAAPTPAQLLPPGSVVSTGSSTFVAPNATEQRGVQVINLIRVPGSQQVLLKVRVAELNRTSLRRIGADILAEIPEFGTLLGTRIGGASIGTTSTFTGQALDGTVSAAISPMTTAFGIFEEAHFQILLTALRQNSLLKILAEPNLVALNGHEANFLAGGEFPVPVPQTSGGIGTSPTVTVQFREFGVRLGFLPIILPDGVIRLTVDPEVSSIDFTIGTTLVAGGSVVPGLNTRKSHTTVEMKQGQTLAIAGLLQLSLDGQTNRIPGLGDLPILGPFFSNTSSQRMEKELIVLVTPYLVEAMDPEQVPPGPGDEVNQPNDLELYFLNRIEGRTGRDARATTNYDDPLHVVRHMILEKKYFRGLFGFSD